MEVLNPPLDREVPACRLVEGVRPLGHALLRQARERPEAEALVFPDARLTYAELADAAWSTARSLVGLGVGPGDHVGLLMTNHPDFVISYYGTILLGAVAVPINARYKRSELSFVVADADLTVLLTHDSADDHVNFSELLHEALPGLADARDAAALELPGFPRLRAAVMIGGSSPAGMVDRRGFDRLAQEADEANLITWVEGVKVRSVGLVLYTSGTTSAPRGAVLTHEAFARIWEAAADRFATTDADRHWTALPLFHVTALGCMTWVFSRGATFLSDYRVDAARALETMERERVTEFYPAYPAVMEDITGHPAFASTDLSTVRVFLNVAPPELLARFQSRLPAAIQMTTYGMTEGGPITLTHLDDSLEVRLSTCGDSQPGVEVEIRDGDGSPVPTGTSGEITFRGFNAFSGYYGDAEKTRATLAEDGWVRTGDLGQLDQDGRLLFLGRVKETLKVGGENVAPQEIEQRLVTHPSVRLAQVVGIPDPRLDEVPAAFVELAEGAQASEDELLEHCRGQIASFKVPRLISFIGASEWPMSATKVQRARLRERLLLELDAAAAPDPDGGSR